MNLNPVQVLIIGLVALVLTALLSWLIEKGIPWMLTAFKIKTSIDLGRFVKTLIVGVVAFLLAWWWYPATLPVLPIWAPPFGNEFQQFCVWIPILLAALSPYVGAAMVIYNLILGYILDPEKRTQLLQSLMNLLLPVQADPPAQPTHPAIPPGTVTPPPTQ
ncbi:MAG: hypothetical protein ABSA23_04755 [Anaerolineales bacterium]|jgi:hypothetical protein